MGPGKRSGRGVEGGAVGEGWAKVGDCEVWSAMERERGRYESGVGDGERGAWKRSEMWKRWQWVEMDLEAALARAGIG